MTRNAPRITDPREFGRVAVLLGGTSSEREVSLDSGRNVLEALTRQGVDAAAVDGIPALVAALTAPDGRRFDRVFNILHGNRGGGEDGVLQGLLEALGVPYTGSGVLGSALSMDKIRTKQVWLSLGLPTPAYASLARGDDVAAAARKIGLPVIVKPACEGSSVGVSRCFKDADLAAAVELAARYEGPLLVEQLIQGDEFTVAVLGNEALPSIPTRTGVSSSLTQAANAACPGGSLRNACSSRAMPSPSTRQAARVSLCVSTPIAAVAIDPSSVRRYDGRGPGGQQCVESRATLL
jgi:D-alanine-D-alanine ligase